MSFARPTSVLLSVLLTLIVASASAQSTRDQVRALNREAIEAYHQLEIDHALELLERALVIADQGGLGGQELARTHANLGIIAVAGLSDNGRGISHFQSALQADPNVQLDPQISTPEVNAIFQQARARLAGQAVTPPPTQPTPDPNGGDVTTGLTHTPAPEQLLHTPLPIYVAVADTLSVSRVVVRYRARGMRNFAEVALTAMVDGYGIELPCTDIFEPQVEYYIVAYAANGSEVGHVGSAQSPRIVRIVRARRYAPPALPGRVPPPQCSDHECPPNLPSCRRPTPSTGTQPRRQDNEDAPSGEDEGSSNDVPRLYLQVGGVVGAAYARPDMVADRQPTDMSSTNDAFISPAEDASCDAPPGEYCVRVTQAGFMPVYGARVMLGYFVAPRVAISVGARYQILAGEGTLSHVLLSFRSEFLATAPVAVGFRALVHIGTSFGQIQVQPVQRGTDVEPYAQVGLGSAQVGGTLGYRFIRNLGVFVTPEAHVFYRRLSVALDVALGLEAAF